MASRLSQLCSWENVDTRETLARFGVSELFSELGIGEVGEDLFGEEPSTHIHPGSVVVAEHVKCLGGFGIFVIDGSLQVDGTFSFGAYDGHTVLVVTGDLEAKHVNQFGDTQLVVLGATKVQELVRIDVSDAGFALFRGPVSAADYVITENDVEYDVPMFAQEPQGLMRAMKGGDAWSENVVALAGKYPDSEKFHDVLVKGVSLFA